MKNDPLSSPRIARLRAELKAGGAGALERFWTEAAATGTPLFEDSPEEDRVRVTFLWRGNAEMRSVAVLGQGIGYGYAASQLQRLGETDLWHRTFSVPRDARFTYAFFPNAPRPLAVRKMPEKVKYWDVLGMERWSALFGSGGQPDPLNPRHFLLRRDEDVPESRESAVSVALLPEAPDEPWLERVSGVPEGRVELHRLRSQAFEGERRVWIYTPPGMRNEGDPCSLAVLFDGFPYLFEMAAPTVLDNLIHAGAIPPLVLALVDNPGELRRQELACSEAFTGFAARELVPWIWDRYPVTHDPGRTVIGGLSLGGLAAAFAGLSCPDVFGCVLSQSGSYWWNPPHETEGCWLAREFVRRPRQRLRFYQEVGRFEANALDDRPGMLLSNRHFRDVLEARGYPVDYREFGSGHEVFAWRGTLPEGLISLLNPPPEETPSRLTAP